MFYDVITVDELLEKGKQKPLEKRKPKKKGLIKRLLLRLRRKKNVHRKA